MTRTKAETTRRPLRPRQADRLLRPLLRAGDEPGGWRARRALRRLVDHLDADPVDPAAAAALARLAAAAPPPAAAPTTTPPAAWPVDASDGSAPGGGVPDAGAPADVDLPALAPPEAAVRALLRAVTQPGAGKAGGGGAGADGAPRVSAVVQAVARQWIGERPPALLGVLVAAAAPPTAVLPAAEVLANVPLLLLLRALGSAGTSPSLAELHPHRTLSALDDVDATIRAAAADALRDTGHPDVATALARHCLSVDSPGRIDLLAANPGWPTGGVLRVFTAAVRGRADVVAELGMGAVPILLDQIAQARAPAAEAFRRALRSLADPAAQDLVCRTALHLTGTDELTAQPTGGRVGTRRRGDEARAAALDAGYLPASDPDRALFLFLTEQWDRYTRLDFDGRLLGVAYAAADRSTQARLRNAARSSGRADALRLVVGGDLVSRATRLSRAEVDYLLDTLIADRRFGEAWRLLLELPFAWALGGAARLAQAGFSPTRSDERALLLDLRAAARVDAADLAGRAATAAQALMLQAGEARVAGRVSGVCFAPDAPHLALGTSSPPRVGLWDLAAGRLLWSHRGFAHAIGPVRHVGGGIVYAAEHTADPGARTGVYVVDESGPRRLGDHAGFVSAMAALPDGGVVTASRDGTVAFWDENGQRGGRLNLGKNWARSLAVSPDGTQLLVGRRGLARYRLPSRRPAGSLSTRNVSASLGFSPDSTRILLGRHTSTIVVCDEQAGGKLQEGAVVTVGVGLSDANKVVEVAPLTGRGLVLAATADGWVRGYRWPDWSAAHQAVDTRASRMSPSPYYYGVAPLASATVSGSEAYVAVGHADGIMSLWDLRAAEVHRVLTRPLGEATPADLDAIEGAATWLPESATLATMLRHRFRYDIHLSVPTAGAIRAGRHDIELG